MNTGFRKIITFASLALILSAMPACKKKVPLPPVPVDTSSNILNVSVYSVRPGQGRTDSSTSIVVSGTGFKEGAKVFVGEMAALDVTVTSRDVIKATIPAGIQPGTYNVIVRNLDGRESMLQGGFTVTPIPVDNSSSNNQNNTNNSNNNQQGAVCTFDVIYFDFDASSLSQSARDLIQKNMNCAKQMGNKTIVLEGHTDERGSTDYNLALGQRRADEVKKYLSTLGLTNARSMSFGEERPSSYGSTEESWHNNRRVEFKLAE